MLNQDVVREATRLTRAGQLVEAAALLQRMLRGDSAPGSTSRGTARDCVREARSADHRREGQRRRGDGNPAARLRLPALLLDANAPRRSVA